MIENTGKRAKKANPPANQPDRPVNYRYGPMPTFSDQKLWTRSVIIIGVVIYMWITWKSGKERLLAIRSETIPHRSEVIECSLQFSTLRDKFSGCSSSRCGRFVSDVLVTQEDAKLLFHIAQTNLDKSANSGGFVTLNLSPERLSHFHHPHEKQEVLSKEDVEIVEKIEKTIINYIAKSFELDKSKLLISNYPYFIKMWNADPKGVVDEYWHIRSDLSQHYNALYSAIIFLSNYRDQFKGGRLQFVNHLAKPVVNSTVEPKLGRLVVYTAATENSYSIERVERGAQYALVLHVSCKKDEGNQ